MNYRGIMLAIMRGETVDAIPFVPRLDLWWLSNVLRGTLPPEFAGMKPDDIARRHGWGLYHMVPDFSNMMRGPEDILHRALGLFQFKQSVYGWRLPKDVEVVVKAEDGLQVIEYHTPRGMARTVGGHTEEMKKKGASLGWTREHALSRPEAYDALAYLFENLEVFPQYDGAAEYMAEIGDGGVVAAGGASLGASPMHHIQKEFIDATQFFYEYTDNYERLAALARSVEVYFDKVLAVIEASPAEVVLWGANYDDMLTWPPYFKKDILPWLQKASARLAARGKIVATHTDGENRGLLDLIASSGAHVAESLTPAPMTRVPLAEYYSRWPTMTLMGCIPECLLLPESPLAALDSFLDSLFTLRPGNRLILGIADSLPPNADFSRLLHIADRIAKEGRLPLG
jgi:hypothetical protein